MKSKDAQIRKRNIFRNIAKRVNRKSGGRLDWKQMDPQEGWSVVKGTTHRVIVVKSPDKRYFEEAIFVVRDEILRESGASSETILKEAQKIASSYMSRYQKLRPGTGKLRGGGKARSKGAFISRMPAPLIAAAGAAATGVAWLTAHLVGL